MLIQRNMSGTNLSSHHHHEAQLSLANQPQSTTPLPYQFTNLGESNSSQKLKTKN